MERTKNERNKEKIEGWKGERKDGWKSAKKKES